jgi:hypothetical protein
MPQLLFLCFGKVTQEILSELDKTKAEVPYFSDTMESKAETEEGQRVATPPPLHGMATPWLRQGLVWAPGPPPDTALPPIYSPRRENPKHSINFPENILQAAAIVDARSGGFGSSFRHPAGEGNHHWWLSSSLCLPPE